MCTEILEACILGAIYYFYVDLLKSTTILIIQMINVYLIQHSNNYRKYLILTPIYIGVEFNLLQTID